MATETAIANLACTLLGAKHIVSIDDVEVKAARELKAVWEIRRDACIRARLWRFALARKNQGAAAGAPAFGFAKRYTIPSDWLRVIQVGDYWSPDFVDYRTGETCPWSIEGREILTDLTAPLPVRGLAQVTDTTQWDACFASYFAADLAWHACEAITQSSAKKADCEAARSVALSEAVRANALETPPREFGDGSWLLSRAGF